MHYICFFYIGHVVSEVGMDFDWSEFLREEFSMLHIYATSLESGIDLHRINYKS